MTDTAQLLREMREAKLAESQSREKAINERWWLIERQETIAFYWTGTYDKEHRYWNFDRDSVKAVRFPTKEAAQVAITYLKLHDTYVDIKDCRYNKTEAVEHIFCSGPTHTDIDCAQYLKEDETPAQRIKRALKDVDGLMTILAKEKKNTETARQELAAAREDAFAECAKICRDAAENPKDDEAPLVWKRAAEAIERAAKQTRTK